MSRIAYVNGRYRDLHDASVNIEDRGYQFADGVYEVCEVRHGKIVDMPRHMVRLDRSLRELRIGKPMSDPALQFVIHEVVRRNRVTYGMVYLQITRGVAHREHAFPPNTVRPSVVVTAKNLNLEKSEKSAAHGIAVITLPENRWPRVDIKSVSLLPNVLAKQQAKEQGAYEAWFVDSAGYVTEGSSSNAWIVTKDGKVVTRSAAVGILPGITRAVLIEALAALQLRLEERPFTTEEANDASEAFISASTQLVMPVVKIDGKAIGNGLPGPITLKLRTHFHEFSTFS
ncbi:MAG: D-amino-acid transaminase [Xanthobacteraceae bacterium]|nr:D-amino-acid transaminase [Xanthobacteraceae bacterium]